MSFNLNGIALVTGAASGVGKATALGFAEAGALGVVLADLNHQEAAAVAEESKRLATNPEYRTLAVHVDVSDEESVKTMVAKTAETFGRIDYSVNSAGIGVLSHNPIVDSNLEEYEKLNSVNNRGIMLCMREVTRVMIKQEVKSIKSRNGTRILGRGSIVNVGSSNAYITFSGFMSYTASKHAMVGLSKTAALDNAPHNIRVNVVCPSWVDTPMMQGEFDKIPTLLDTIKKMSPAGRMALPEEVADTVLFLSSAAASYMNGASVMVDSGLTDSVPIG